ncbi:MAG: DUF1648 domain-containing protein [Peptostreptococcaceae bacterium]
MNDILALLISIPNLFFIYLIFYFTQSLSGKRQFYGVSLNSDYFDKEEFKSLDKKYKKLNTLGFVFTLLITLILIFSFNAYDVAILFSCLGFISFHFIVYVNIHNNVKSLKSKIMVTNPGIEIKKSKMLLDTDFLNEKNHIIKKFSILYALPTAITILVSIYALTKYSSAPDMIPTHWGFTGEADAFSKKSFFSFSGMILMMVLISISIYVSSISSLKTRAKLSIVDIEASKKAHIYYLNKYGLTFLVLNVSCQILFISILIATANASNINTYILWPSTIITIISSLYLTYIYYKSPNRIKDAVYSVDDEDSLWILGCIYNNPNDPSLFVNKRFGVGWTVNIGITKGRIFFILPFIILIFSFVLAMTM